MYDMLFIESFSSSLPCRERFMSSYNTTATATKSFVFQYCT